MQRLSLISNAYNTNRRKEKTMTEHYFDRTSELAILGNWLDGKHREDLTLLDASIFQCKELYKAAKEGNKTYLQLMAESKTDGVPLSELIRAKDPDGIGGTFAEAAYREARATALLFQRDILINRLSEAGADIPATTEKLLQLQAAIDRRETKPAAAKLSEHFIKALDEEAAAKTMNYGRGFKNLTTRAGSIKRGQLIVLGARPATGKSAAALQIGYDIAKSGGKVLFFPLEMTTQETLERLILQQEIVKSNTQLRAPHEEERAAMIDFLDAVEAKGNFLIYEGVNQLETIEQTIKEQQPDFVVIDQLTQVRIAKKTPDIRTRYVEATAQIKHIAMEYNCAILLLTQLNREAKETPHPTLENLHESDATGQNADVVILMGRQDGDERTPDYARQTIIYMNIVKNRGGESGFFTTQKFYGNRFKFYDK